MVSRFLREIPTEMFHAPKKRASMHWEDSGPSVRKLDFRPGDRVKHGVFGLGIVESVEPSGNDALVTVAFEDVGRKRLMLSFAALEKIEDW